MSRRSLDVFWAFKVAFPVELTRVAPPRGWDSSAAGPDRAREEPWPGDGDDPGDEARPSHDAGRGLLMDDRQFELLGVVSGDVEW